MKTSASAAVDQLRGFSDLLHVADVKVGSIGVLDRVERRQRPTAVRNAPRRDVSAAEICVLQAFTNRLRDKLKEVNPSEYVQLRGMVHLLIRTLESTAVENMVDPLPDWLAEVGFASSYLLERYDLIPDHIPGIGLADDILILQHVIARNQSDLYRILREDNGAVTDQEDPDLR